MDRTTLQRTAEHWGRQPVEEEKTFFGFPPLQPYLAESITGDARIAEWGKDWLTEWTVQTFFPDRIPVKECLVLCCGFGELERTLGQRGYFEHCLAIDLSEGAIREARRLAENAELGEKIEYRIADLNTLELPSERFDLVWANGALHHLWNLKEIIPRLVQAMTPEGWLVANEYVGPAYRRLPHRQRELINAVIHLLPPRLRTLSEGTYVPPSCRISPWRRYAYKLFCAVTRYPAVAAPAPLSSDASWWRRWRYRLERFLARSDPFFFGKVWDETSALTLAIDPSEGVSSDQILPLLRAAFPSVEVRYYHGSLLHYALERRFYEAFDPSSKEDRELLSLLIQMEKTFIQSGEIASDHAHILAKKGSR